MATLGPPSLSFGIPGAEAVAMMTDVLVQPDGSPAPGGERLEPGPEEPEGKRPSTTGARLWGRVRSKLLRQKVPGGLGGTWRWWGASSWLPRTRWLWSGGEARVWVRLGTPLLRGGGWGALLGCLRSFLAT